MSLEANEVIRMLKQSGCVKGIVVGVKENGDVTYGYMGCHVTDRIGIAELFVAMQKKEFFDSLGVRQAGPVN